MNPNALKIIEILGGGDQARMVGGCVRNYMMKMQVSDIDIATKHTPGAVTEILEKETIKVIPTGIDHGTVTAVIEKENFEITTLRRDIDTDGRHAKVEFSQSWEEDARRRDFTINTLLMDEHKNIYDPLGQGEDDIKTRRVIFVGDADQRIKEDVLRILRFFRFNAIYGAGETDAQALEACAANAHLIPSLSKERITQEFLKIIMAERARETLSVMNRHNIMKELTSVAYNNFDSLSMIGRLFALSQDTDIHETYLRFSNKQKSAFKALLKAMQFGVYHSEKHIKKALYYHGAAAVEDAYYLTIEEPSQADLDCIKNTEIPKFPLTGKDLIQEGYQQNEKLGEELKRREKEWVDNGFKF